MQREDVCSVVSCVNISSSCLIQMQLSLELQMCWQQPALAKLSVSNPFSFFCRRDALSGEDVLNLASFLGEQLRNLHLLPCPPFNESSLSDKLKTEPPFNNGFVEDVVDTSSVPAEWEIFIRTLARKKKNLVNRLTAWYVYLFQYFVPLYQY